MFSELIAPALGIAGQLISGNAASGASNTLSAAQLAAAQKAADMAKFTPVGVTTAFGKSNFGFDPQGKLSSAGYTLTPEMQAQLASLQGLSSQNINQALNAPSVSQPMLSGAGSMFNLGNQYLATSPQEQAAKYMADQQALLAPSRESQLAGVRNSLFNSGRSGLAVGGTSVGGMAATNPEMAAYYNAIAQQDAQLAANATQGGMDYAKFGAGMFGAGASSLGNYYDAQKAALSPYASTLGMMNQIDQYGQNALNLGANLGSQSAQSGAQAGNFYQTGANNAAQTMFKANSYSPLGTILSGAGGMLSNFNFGGTPSGSPVSSNPSLAYTPSGNSLTYGLSPQSAALLNPIPKNYWN